MKYGPLGHTVNLAARIEGATKHMGLPMLVSQHTRGLINEPFVWRRLCKVRVTGIVRPVELHEFHGLSADDEWLVCRDQYEQALELCEQNQCEAAQELVTQLLKHPKFENDRPTQLLAERSAAFAQMSAADYDPVFELKSK